MFSYIDQHKFRYGFDIRSLNILIEKSNINPYNRTAIPANIILTIRNRIEELKQKNINVTIEDEITLTEEQKIKSRIINIFQKIE